MSRAGQFKIKWVSSLERFKNRILSNIPDLKVYKNGRDKSLTLHKEWSFPLIISPVNVTKPAFFRRHWHFLVTFTKEILNGKLHFSCSVTFDEDIGIALKIVSEKHCADEAAILVKAAKFVWRDMAKHKYVFDGNFQTNCQKNSVPSSLFFHMSMVIRGSSIKVISDNVSVIQDLLTLSQHLQYKCTSCRRDKQQATQNHSQERQSPCPTYVELLVHM